jgi:hypothetical protein
MYSEVMYFVIGLCAGVLGNETSYGISLGNETSYRYLSRTTKK